MGNDKTIKRENIEYLRDLKDALSEVIEECGYTFASSETIIGYVYLKSGRKAQVTLKVEADQLEWVAD